MGDATDRTRLFYLIFFMSIEGLGSLYIWHHLRHLSFKRQEYPLAKVYERKFGWNGVIFWVLRLAGTGQRGNYTKEGLGKMGQKWQKAQIVLYQDWYQLPATGCKYAFGVSHRPELCAKDLGHEKVIILAECNNMSSSRHSEEFRMLVVFPV